MQSLVLRLSAVAAALGFLSLGTAALFATTHPARADSLGPEVTGGSQPYVTLSGTVPIGPNMTVYTVPSNRILVVTAASFSSFASLYQDATLKVNGQSYAMYAASNSGFIGVLATGNGRLVFAPGSNIVIQGVSSNTAYYIQGYLAHP